MTRAIAIGLCLLAAGCETPLQWRDATNRSRGPDLLQLDMQACARTSGGGAVTASTTAAWDACMRGFGWAHN